MRAAMAKIATAMIGGAAHAGWVSIHDHRGAVIDTELVSAIQPGVDNKDSVSKMLGRPTFTGTFGDSDWYYVSRDTRTVAFRNPTVQKQTVLPVRFDPAGNVASIQKTGKELVLNVDPSGRRTPTLGRDKSFFEELVGNIGSVGSAGMPGYGGNPPQ